MIQVINRALDILEILAGDLDKKYYLGEIAGKLNLNHGTCANIIKTMVDRGFIQNYGKKGGYSLGLKAYHLTGNLSYKNELLKIAVKPISDLRTKINENCIIAYLKANMRITLYKETNTLELQATSREEKDAYSTATGRAILAFKSMDEQESFIHEYGLPNEQWEEVKNKSDLIKELNKIKETQVAIHHAESDIVGVSAPIFKDDKVIASIGVYLPESRFKYKAQETIITETKKTAAYINGQLKNLEIRFNDLE